MLWGVVRFSFYLFKQQTAYEMRMSDLSSDVCSSDLLRDLPGLKKKPSTSEWLDWLKLLLAEDIDPAVLHDASTKKTLPPLYGALLKNESDVHLFERVAFMARRSN